MDSVVNKHGSKKAENAAMPKKGEGKPPELPAPGLLERLHEACADRKITTPAQFADFVGVGRSTGHKWYRGNTAKISAIEFIHVADKLEVSLRWLLLNDGPKHSPVRARSETEARIIDAYRVSTAGELKIIHSWLENQEQVHKDELQSDVKFTRRGKN